MQLTRIKLVLAVSSLLAAGCACGQIPVVPVESVLAYNTAKLKVTVKMDRDVYFPGELYEATFEVTNPTTSPLLVVTPFQGAECVLLLVRKGGDLVNLRGSHGGCRYVDGVPAPVTTFAPGETRKAVLHSYGEGEDFWPSLSGGLGAPDHEGTFVLRYVYGPEAEVEFTVAHAKVEATAVARVKDMMYTDRPGFEDPHPLPTYVDVFSLRWQDQSYICVSQGTRGNLWRDPVKKKADEIDAVLPYKRVATSEDPVVNLTATADFDENLTIEWKTATGGQGRFYYPASYVSRDAHERFQKRIQELRERDDN